MNSWANEQFMMHNMVNMSPMMQNTVPNPMMHAIPDIPAEFPTVEAQNPNPGPMIGPTIPEGHNINDDTIETVDMQISGNDNNTGNQGKSNRNGRDRNESRRDRERDRERDRGDKRRRTRSHDRNRFDRHDRPDRPERVDRPERYDRRNDRRDRRSKWDSNEATNLGTQQLSMMMPGTIMPYGNMLPGMVGQQNIDMSNMSHVGTMANMQSMANMIPGMQMMSNMIDPNLMMMNQHGQISMTGNQLFFTKGVLLPPIHGVTTPSRRERPPGCRTIFVGGLPHGITDDVVNEIFLRFGTIDIVKLHKQGVCHVRFERQECVDLAFAISGYRFKYHEQMENEATTMFIDFALNRDDQNEYEKQKRRRMPTPPRVENFTAAALNTISEKIKSDNEFAEAAPTLAFWLEHGECNKKNSNTFYSLIQASNNQIRRLFNEKMQIDDEFQTMKTTIKDKFAHIILQFEQVAKILCAAKHQRASDHFNKQQRRNIEMWLKMTEEVDNIKEEFNTIFDDEETEKVGKNMVTQEKYEELRTENENLMYELEGYKNEAYLAKDEAERKFEKFKAHYVAQQALQNNQAFPPLPPPPMPMILTVDPPLPIVAVSKPKPPPPTPDDSKIITSGPLVPPSEAKLISILTAFLMVHPLGASVDYLVSYVRSMVPQVTQATVQQVLQKYNDVFQCKTSGVGATIEHKWCFTTFDVIKGELSEN